MTQHARDLTDCLVAFRDVYGRPPRWALCESYGDGGARWTTREDQLANGDYVRGFADTIDEAVAWVREKTLAEAMPEPEK